MVPKFPGSFTPSITRLVILVFIDFCFGILTNASTLLGVESELILSNSFTDTLICILTNTMIGVTGAWHTLNHLIPSDVVAQLLSSYIPYSDLFMTLLLFFAGFTTIIAYLSAGTKCAQFINPKYGKTIYLMYAIFAFIFFCNFSQVNVMIIMGLLSGLLVLLNVCGILKLRKDIEF